MLSVCGCHCTAYLQCVYSGLSWSIAWWHVDGTSMALSVPERLSWWSHALRISIGKLSECLKGVDPSQLRHMPDKLKDWQPLRPLPWFSMIYSWYPHFPWRILQLAGFNSVPTSSAGVLLRCVILCHDLPPNVTPGLLGCMHVRAVQFWLICDTCFKLAQMMGFCFCFFFECCGSRNISDKADPHWNPLKSHRHIPALGLPSIPWRRSLRGRYTPGKSRIAALPRAKQLSHDSADLWTSGNFRIRMDGTKDWRNWLTASYIYKDWTPWKCNEIR